MQGQTHSGKGSGRRKESGQGNFRGNKMFALNDQQVTELVKAREQLNKKGQIVGVIDRKLRDAGIIIKENGKWVRK